MWQIKKRFSQRPPIASISIAFLVSSIVWFFRGESMSIVIGGILAGVGIIILIGIVCIPLKKEIPPIEVGVKKSRVVWGMWFTGSDVLQKDLIGKYDSIQRILLMQPDSPAFKRNIEITGESEKQAKDEILKLTKRAVDKGVDVRWYLEHIGIGLTLFDKTNVKLEQPFSNKAYCVVQLLIPNAPGNERPTYIGKNQTGKAGYFIGMLKKFNDIWDSNNLSRKPSKEEYEHA